VSQNVKQKCKETIVWNNNLKMTLAEIFWIENYIAQKQSRLRKETFRNDSFEKNDSKFSVSLLKLKMIKN